MPDIDINPAALSRPSINIATPTLATKTITVSGAGIQKTTKSSQIIPARIDLEPLYTALKAAINPEQWISYKETIGEFFCGRLNQAEYSERIDPILDSPNGEKVHLHNQLLEAIHGNLTREMPDQGPAPWVSANDKPVVPTGIKPVTGDAAERRLKGEVMLLPARDRRRVKDLAQNDFDPHESMVSVFMESRRRPSAASEVPASAGVLNNMNLDLEIRKRFAQPLAVESGEFPDVGMIGGRMMPFCYEAGLVSGHAADAAQFISVATETFIKEVLNQIFSRTRSNGPGEAGSAGFGVGTTWVQTRQYRKQLNEEEDTAQHGKLTRDKNGLLPVESKAARERGPLSMADLRLSLEMGDTGMSSFPLLMVGVMSGYREGELENWTDYTWVDDEEPISNGHDWYTSNVNGHEVFELPNGPSNGGPDPMDIDSEPWWDGTDVHDMDMIDGVLESCLAVNS
ncbi:unnamed protein product [Clonostachys rhizophaga]|uniref:Transcriptional coactivator HFI1/ADA1 n=1 Tax=Clonostachys rhizophaga TaxID=160324 RepID=A0A9N9YRP3_9HYPO|nr:unnamed protein product [Clonostachys rhizophaga]